MSRSRAMCVMCGWEDPTWEWWSVQCHGTGFEVTGWMPTASGEAVCSRGCVEKWVERWAAPRQDESVGV